MVYLLLYSINGILFSCNETKIIFPGGQESRPKELIDFLLSVLEEIEQAGNYSVLINGSKRSSVGNGRGRSATFWKILLFIFDRSIVPMVN